MAKPFVKWAGGKTQLINEIDERIWQLRESSREFVYVEPFVGGGSVLFHLLDTCSNMRYAVINDANEQLINTYRIIKDNDQYREFKEQLYNMQESYNADPMKKERFNLIRLHYNHWIKGDVQMSAAWGAATFVFINKCCFNGIYRVNKSGEFNVPWGQKDYVYAFNEDELDKVHIALSEKVAILCGDYSKTDVVTNIAAVEGCDTIYYLDPPYKPISSTANFTSYTKDDFSDKDQENLKAFCDRIDRDGGKFLLSNSKCGDYFDILYDGYTIETVSAKRLVNRDSSKRGNVEEILIHN